MLVLAAGCVLSQSDESSQGVQVELRFPHLEQQNQQLAQVLDGVAAKLNELQTMITNRLGTLC